MNDKDIRDHDHLMHRLRFWKSCVFIAGLLAFVIQLAFVFYLIYF